MARLANETCALFCAGALVCALSGCARKAGRTAAEYEVVKEAIEGIFGVTVPVETREIVVYLEAWQEHGMYAYFEVPSNRLDLVKTRERRWIEIPVQYRTSPLSGLRLGSEDPNEVRWFPVVSNVRSHVDRVVDHLKIQNPQRLLIRWVYDDLGYAPVPGAPEKRQVVMISDEGDGVHGCYVADRDIRNYAECGRLYKAIPPEMVLRVSKPSQ